MSFDVYSFESEKVPLIQTRANIAGLSLPLKGAWTRPNSRRDAEQHIRWHNQL